MAKIDNLLEGGEGSLGDLVLYKMHGKTYVRTKPSQYRDKKSPAQLAQRQRLQVMNSFLRAFREPLRVTFSLEAKGRSALQAAQSYNMRHALAGEYPNIVVDKSKALLSKGPLPLPVTATISAHPDGLFIEWENGPEAAGNAAGHTLVVMALSEEGDRSDYKFTEIRRSGGQYVWKTALPTSETALPDVWIAFRNSEMTAWSDSMYLKK